MNLENDNEGQGAPDGPRDCCEASPKTQGEACGRPLALGKERLRARINHMRHEANLLEAFLLSLPTLMTPESDAALALLLRGF